ncbi:MAG: hypothetical protein ACE367_07340 [Acidimicrobiales bacterium]
MTEQDTPADDTDPGDQRGAEMLDADKLGGNSIGSDARIAEEQFPPDEPLGVEDPAIVQGGSGTRDDLDTREWRTEDEPQPEED